MIFLLGIPNYKDSLGIMTGAVFGFNGNSTLDTIPIYKIIGHQKWYDFGESIDIVGDINGDGYDDVLISEPSYPDYNKPAGKIFIYSYKSLTNVEEQNTIVPNDILELRQNYPNPFNNETIINYKLKYASIVKIKLFNTLGAEIATLADENKFAGEYILNFNSNMYSLSSGIYYIKISVMPIIGFEPALNKVIKTILLK